MAGVNVSIAPEILDWIIEKVQLGNINRSIFNLLNKWKTGEKVPTFNQVEEVSRKTTIPFGYFFLEKPSVEDCRIVEYRTVDSLAVQEPSRNLIDIVDMMTNAQEWMIEYVKDNGQEPLSFVACDKNERSASVIANHIRGTLKLDTVWFENSKSAAESFRIICRRLADSEVMVMISGTVGSNTHRKLSVDEFRAFTLVDPYVPLIFINVCDSENGKLFSLFHETAHIWLGTDSFYNEPYASDHKVSNLEVLCNAVNTITGESINLRGKTLAEITIVHWKANGRRSPQRRLSLLPIILVTLSRYRGRNGYRANIRIRIPSGNIA